MQRKSVTIIALLAFTFITGCVSVHIDTPDGFARYRKSGKIIKVISPEGVSLRVRHVDNKPRGDSDMWMESVVLFMKSQGYTSVKKGTVKTIKGMKGRYVEFVYNHYGKPYNYLVALFIKGKKIHIIEAGGRSRYYKERRAALLKAIQSFKIE